MLRLDIEANGFLYNMVRIIMGTLLEVGRKRIQSDEIADILKSQDRIRGWPNCTPARIIFNEGRSTHLIHN